MRVESKKYTVLGKLGYYIARDKFLRNHISTIDLCNLIILYKDYPFILKIDGYDNYK